MAATLSQLLTQGTSFSGRSTSGKVYVKGFAKDLDGGANDILKFAKQHESFTSALKIETEILVSGTLLQLVHTDRGYVTPMPTGEDLAEEITLVFPEP